MTGLNDYIFNILSVINLGGCCYAIYNLYNYFSPGRRFDRKVNLYTHMLILCLFLFASYQVSNIATDMTGFAWTMKVGTLVFWYTALKFTGVAELLEKKDQTI